MACDFEATDGAKLKQFRLRCARLKNDYSKHSDDEPGLTLNSSRCEKNFSSLRTLRNEYALFVPLYHK